MMEKKDKGSREGKDNSRRDFLAKSARVLYVAPLVVSYDISEAYDESEGYALAFGMSPKSVSKGMKGMKP